MVSPIISPVDTVNSRVVAYFLVYMKTPI